MARVWCLGLRVRLECAWSIVNGKKSPTREEQLVLRYGPRIAFQTEGPGSGLTFTINSTGSSPNSAHRTNMQTFRLHYMLALASACGSSNACRVPASRLRSHIIYIFIHMIIYTYRYIRTYIDITLTLIFSFPCNIFLLLHLYLRL